MKNLFAAAFAFAFATAFALAADIGKDGAPSFNLPVTVFAAPGVACNVYYMRVFDSVVPQRYSFEALCETGSAFGDCWRLTPRAEQAGKSYRLVLNAWDDTGLVAAGTTTVVVARAPTDEEKGRRITLALLARLSR